ncbi:unnamed protein product, partial [Adineta steineri]
MHSTERLSEDPQVILKDLHRLRNQHQNYLMPYDQPKQTIILLGRSGVGKTTISNVIKDSLYYSPRSTFSHPIQQQPDPQQKGGLSIIDAPDIFDVQNRPSKCELTEGGLRVDHFHIPFNDNILPLFGLVFSIQQGISSADIEAILNFKAEFEQLSRKMILILTHCEE